MTTHKGSSLPEGKQDPTLSLYHLLNPEVLANPYPLYHRLRSEDPVHWDHYLHTWVVTCYADVITVLRYFSAHRIPTPEQLTALGLSAMTPLAQMMAHQTMFLDPPAHTRMREITSKAFAPCQVEILRSHIRDITNSLLDAIEDKGHMDVIADLAYPLSAMVTAKMLGVPTSDWKQLTMWSADLGKVLGNFQYNLEHIQQVVGSLEEMTTYFRTAIEDQKKHPRDGFISTFLNAEMAGERLTDEEIVANALLVMAGGQEETTNLIGNGILTLLRHQDQLEKLRADLSLLPSAVEEVLRYESASQYTARLAHDDVELGGKKIRKRQAVIAVMGAANRDPERFPDPDSFDICRQDNRHLTFGWASHFCVGAQIARIEAKNAFGAVLERMPNLQLAPGPLVWRESQGLRGLAALHVTF